MRLVWSFSRLLSRLSGTTSLPTLCTQHFSDSMSLALLEENLEASKGYDYKFPHLRITRKAFPPKTEKEIFGYQSFLGAINDSAVITDSAGSPMTPHSPASPAAYSSPKAGTSAPLVR